MNNPLRIGLMVVSVAALVWLFVAAVLFFTDAMTLAQTKAHLLIATIVWFVVTPIWMLRPKAAAEA